MVLLDLQINALLILNIVRHINPILQINITELTKCLKKKNNNKNKQTLILRDFPKIAVVMGGT